MLVLVKNKSGSSWFKPENEAKESSRTEATSLKSLTKESTSRYQLTRQAVPKRPLPNRRPNWTNLVDSKDKEGEWTTLVWEGFNGHVYFEPLRCRPMLNSRSHAHTAGCVDDKATRLPRVGRSAHLKYSLDTALSVKNRGNIGSLMISGESKNSQLKRTGHFVQTHDFRTKVFRGIVNKSHGLREKSPHLSTFGPDALVEGSKASPKGKLVVRKVGDCTCRQQQREVKIKQNIKAEMVKHPVDNSEDNQSSNIDKGLNTVIENPSAVTGYDRLSSDAI